MRLPLLTLGNANSHSHYFLEHPPLITPPLSWLLVLGTLTAFAPMSIDMYLPALPAIANTFGMETVAVQFTLSSFFIGLALGQTIHGPLADRFGRKPPLYVGLGIFVLASLGCALTTNFSSLIILRFMQALGGCAGLVIARAIVRDCCDAHTSARVFSLLMLIMGLAPILAPLLGGWVLLFLGWRAIFVVLAFFGLICIFLVWRYLQETRPEHTVSGSGVGAALVIYRDIIHDRHFIGYALTGGLAYAGLFAYITGSPQVFIEVYGVSAQNYGWLFGLNAFGLIACSQINRYLLTRYSPENILRRTLQLTTIFGVAMFVTALFDKGGLIALLIPLFCYMSSLGFIAPNAAANALERQGMRAGSASALLGALHFGIATVSSTLIGLISSHSALPMAMLIGSCSILAYVTHRHLILTKVVDAPLP